VERAVVLGKAALLTSPAAAQPVTFYWDVLPILQRDCHERHRRKLSSRDFVHGPLTA
jgi:hypothetical protein